MKNNKIALGGGIIGVIILGIFTNAIWDVLRPLTGSLFKLALNLSVLGVERFKDNIYIEIAKGMHEGVSLQVFLLISSFLLSFVLVFIFLFLFIRGRMSFKENNNGNLSILYKIYRFQKDLPRKSWFMWFSLLFYLFAGTIFILDLIKQKYINNAVTNFEQLSKIIRPYISEEQDMAYMSAFSQIKNKKNYTSLIDELQKIAKDNDQETPDFRFTF